MNKSSDYLIQNERIEKINDKNIKNGEYVLYWMQSSQRPHYNHALEYAISRANKLNIPLVAYFALTKFPEANRRHYYFMLEGIKELRSSLLKRGILLIIAENEPQKGVIKFSKNASLVLLIANILK